MRRAYLLATVQLARRIGGWLCPRVYRLGRTMGTLAAAALAAAYRHRQILGVLAQRLMWWASLALWARAVTGVLGNVPGAVETAPAMVGSALVLSVAVMVWARSGRLRWLAWALAWVQGASALALWLAWP